MSSTTATPSHELKLPQLAAKALADALEGPGWAKGPADIVLAGQVLVDVLPEIALPENVATARTQAACHKANAEWCGQEIAFRLTEKQREMVKRALTHWAEKGALPAGRYTTALLTAFGLGEG